MIQTTRLQHLGWFGRPIEELLSRPAYFISYNLLPSLYEICWPLFWFFQPCAYWAHDYRKLYG